jgi:hypothetical protein
MLDANADDLYFEIDMTQVECFNQRQDRIKTVIRPYDNRAKHVTDNRLGTESDYGPELVINIPFKGEVRIKSICIAGASDGLAPKRVKLYKNETNPGIDIVTDKKCIQEV